MATLVRIKRRRNEEPSESIGIALKRSRIEESDAAASDPGNVTVLRRVGTLDTEDEPIESHLNQALEQEKKAWARRTSYKKASALASLASIKENQKKEAKSLSKSERIKLVNARREGLDKVANLFDGVIEEDTRPSKEEDVITCNGVPMKSEKAEYVYDLYFTSVPVEHSSWMENICEFQRYSCDLVYEDELETHQDDYDYDDEDDENDESNWRNDYPEEDDEEEGNESDYLFAMATSVTKKRKYSEEYISYGFTSILADGIEKPQCVLCFKVLGNDSMRPSKLKHHLLTIHPQYAEKDPDFFRRRESSLGKQKLDATGAFQQQTSSVVEASYEVALEIAKQKKPHTIGETLIKPCTLKMVKRVLGDASERKIQQISLSNDTVKRRINEMSDDIKEKVIQEIKSSTAGMFAIQLDESTDVSSCAQLLVFVRYVFLCDIKEEYLLCTQLETTTTAEDVMEKLSSFFKANRIPWENCCGVCTDGAPAMLGSKSGFQKRVKEVAPNAKGVHCMIHRFALASKTLPDELCKILEAVVKCVNFIKAGALNSRLFQNLCRDMDSEHEALLFYSKVRWLSKGNVVNRVFELRGELKLFLEMQRKDDLLSHFNEVLWEPRLAYLADIFEQLNRLNLKLQGKERNVFHLMDCLRGFLAKLQNWQRKVGAGNVAMFENLSAVLDENEEDSLLDPLLKTEITQHLRSLESELNMYFPEFEEEEGKLVRNPFSGTLDITTIPSDVQDEFLDLKHDSAAKDLYEEKSLNVFWCSMHQSYPKVSEIALRLLLPFSTTYLYEAGFSTLLQIKNKSRNRLDVDPDMRCVLSVTQPRIRQLTEKKQYQPSH